MVSESDWYTHTWNSVSIYELDWNAIFGNNVVYSVRFLYRVVSTDSFITLVNLSVSFRRRFFFTGFSRRRHLLNSGILRFIGSEASEIPVWHAERRIGQRRHAFRSFTPRSATTKQSNLYCFAPSEITQCSLCGIHNSSRMAFWAPMVTLRTTYGEWGPSWNIPSVYLKPECAKFLSRRLLRFGKWQSIRIDTFEFTSIWTSTWRVPVPRTSWFSLTWNFSWYQRLWFGWLFFSVYLSGPFNLQEYLVFLVTQVQHIACLA